MSSPDPALIDALMAFERHVNALDAAEAAGGGVATTQPVYVPIVQAAHDLPASPDMSALPAGEGSATTQPAAGEDGAQGQDDERPSKGRGLLVVGLVLAGLYFATRSDA